MELVHLPPDVAATVGKQARMEAFNLHVETRRMMISTSTGRSSDSVLRNTSLLQPRNTARGSTDTLVADEEVPRHELHVFTIERTGRTVAPSHPSRPSHGLTPSLDRAWQRNTTV